MQGLGPPFAQSGFRGHKARSGVARIVMAGVPDDLLASTADDAGSSTDPRSRGLRLRAPRPRLRGGRVLRRIQLRVGPIQGCPTPSLDRCSIATRARSPFRTCAASSRRSATSPRTLCSGSARSTCSSRTPERRADAKRLAIRDQLSSYCAASGISERAVAAIKWVAALTPRRGSLCLRPALC